MKSTIFYLNDAKRALNINSDYGMAKYLGITRTALSNYQTGKRVIDDYAATRIADALGIDKMVVIAAANAEREKSEERKTYWRDLYERLGGMAACLALVTFLVTPPPAEAAETQASKVAPMYIMLIRMRRSVIQIRNAKAVSIPRQSRGL